MEQNEISESTSHGLRSVQVRPSEMHTDRRIWIEEDSESFATYQDTREETEEHYGYV